MSLRHPVAIDIWIMICAVTFRHRTSHGRLTNDVCSHMCDLCTCAATIHIWLHDLCTCAATIHIWFHDVCTCTCALYIYHTGALDIYHMTTTQHRVGTSTQVADSSKEPTHRSHPRRLHLSHRICLFCRIQSLLQGSFAKENYNLIDRSHPMRIHLTYRSPMTSTQVCSQRAAKDISLKT